MIRKLLKYYIIKVIVKLKELKRIYELNIIVKLIMVLSLQLFWIIKNNIINNSLYSYNNKVFIEKDEVNLIILIMNE